MSVVAHVAPLPAVTRAGQPVLSLAELEAGDPEARATIGGERRFLCPLPACADHQNPRVHRCLNVRADTGAWHCWRCGAAGLLADFWTQGATRDARAPVRGRDAAKRAFSDLLALKPVKEPAPNEKAAMLDLSRAGRILPLNGTPGAAYLVDRRGLPAPFCEAENVRFAPCFFGRPAVAFPVHDETGALVAVQGRYADGRDDPRMRTTGQKRRGVFWTRGAFDGEPHGGGIVITEAPIDALTLAFCGFPALALCGKDGLPQWARRICAFRPVYLAFDNDGPGDEAAAKMASALQAVGSDVRRLRPAGKDWNADLCTRGRFVLADETDRALGGEGIDFNNPDLDQFARTRWGTHHAWAHWCLAELRRLEADSGTLAAFVKGQQLDRL